MYQEKLDRIFNFWIEYTGHDVYNGCDAYVRVSFQLARRAPRLETHGADNIGGPDPRPKSKRYVLFPIRHGAT